MSKDAPGAEPRPPLRQNEPAEYAQSEDGMEAYPQPSGFGPGERSTTRHVSYPSNALKKNSGRIAHHQWNAICASSRFWRPLRRCYQRHLCLPLPSSMRAHGAVLTVASVAGSVTARSNLALAASRAHCLGGRSQERGRAVNVSPLAKCFGAAPEPWPSGDGTEADS